MELHRFEHDPHPLLFISLLYLIFLQDKCFMVTNTIRKWRNRKLFVGFMVFRNHVVLLVETIFTFFYSHKTACRVNEEESSNTRSQLSCIWNRTLNSSRPFYSNTVRRQVIHSARFAQLLSREGVIPDP